jgi:hypothetical protein
MGIPDGRVSRMPYAPEGATRIKCKNEITWWISRKKLTISEKVRIIQEEKANYEVLETEMAWKF